ncbi:MAG: hypothetical protein ACOCYU_02515 [Brevefilum sp.]
MSEFVWGLVGFLLTVMILSYLIGDNFFFRLASSLFIGVTAGYLAVLVINDILGPYIWMPLVGGSWAERLWIAVPLILIALLGLSQLPRFSRLGTLPLAFLAGLVAALTIGGAVFGTIIPQADAIVNSFDLARWRVDDRRSWIQGVDAVIMLIGTLTTLSYFHFGRRKPHHPQEETNQRPKALESLSAVGQVFIGVTLGAVFAGVFSSALLALINQMAFVGQFIARWIGGS